MASELEPSVQLQQKSDILDLWFPQPTITIPILARKKQKQHTEYA